MALTINQQFNRFVEFASARNDANNQNTIARVGDLAEGGILAGRMIKEAEGDAVKKLFRADDLQRENDIARKLFRQSIVDIFGGLSRVPDSVKEAMKLKDYDQGKPLTVRRIMAVKAAIDVYAERAVDAFERAKASATEAGIYHILGGAAVDAQTRAQLDRLIATAVNAAVSDPEALELVVAKVRCVIERTGDRTLRSEEAVKDRVADILSNVAELKEAAKGNPGVLRAGLDFLKEMNLKPFKPGVLGTLVRAIMKTGIGDVKALSPDASGMKLHKAVTQLSDNTAKCMEASKVKELHLDGDEKSKIRSFCIRLQMERLGEASARGIKQLLEAKGALLLTGYGEIARGEVNMNALDPAIAQYAQDQARDLDAPLSAFYAELQLRLGTPANEIKMFRWVQNPNYADIDWEDVCTDIAERAEAQARRDRKDFLNTVVEGSGRSANKVRSVFDQALPPIVYDPSRHFSGTQRKNVLGIVNRNFCNGRKHIPNGDPRFSDFNLNFMQRRFDVVLPGGKELERDDTVYDKLAEFVTHGAKKTLATLDAREKNKLLFLISLMSDTIGTAAGLGGMLTLDPNGRDSQKLLTGGQVNKCRFSISFENNNSLLVVKCETERNVLQLGARNESGMYDALAVKPGSKLTFGHKLWIPAAEIDRLAEQDFAAYDGNAAQNRVGDPNVDKPYQNCRALVGQNFAFAPSVEISTTFKFTVN